MSVRIVRMTLKKAVELSPADSGSALARLIKDPYSVNRAFIDPTGRIVAAAGIGGVTDGPGIACAWLRLGDEAGPHLLSIFRGASYLLKRYASRWRVVTTGMPPEWSAFEMWVAALGFEPSARPASDVAKGFRWFELKTGASRALH